MVYRNYRFFNIYFNHSYFDDEKLRIYTETLATIFKNIKELSEQTDGKFRMGISLSGLALENLLEFSPGILGQIGELLRNHTIEILSEPWSHSLLELLDSRSLREQIELHNRAIDHVFGVTPEIFIAHSPLGREMIPVIYSSGKKGIFLYSNLFLEEEITREHGIVFINNKPGKLFPRQGKRNIHHSVSDPSVSLFDKRPGNYLPEYPTIMVSGPIEKNRIGILKNRVLDLVSNAQIKFLLPSEVMEQAPSFTNDELRSENGLNQYKISDFWLENNLQKETFNKMKTISAALNDKNMEQLNNLWYCIQDMENFGFMSLRFLKKHYVRLHYYPYASPYDAYINFRNVLDDFYGSLMGGKKRNTWHIQFVSIGRN